jgi:hypothetical protein
MKFFMGFHGIPWNFMENFKKNSMEFHEIPLNIS